MTFFPGAALVTGAASGMPPFHLAKWMRTPNTHIGIGREVALSFARQRCPQIAVLDLDEAGLENTARECLSINPELTLLRERYDARKEEEVKGAVDSVHHRFGRIDYAINCAGSFPSH